MIRKNGLKYWLKQKEENTALWKRFTDVWYDKNITWKDICNRFDISSSTLVGMIRKGVLERRKML